MASESTSVPYKADESNFVSSHRAHRSFKSEPDTDSSNIILSSASTPPYDLDDGQSLTWVPRPSYHRLDIHKLSSDHRNSKLSPALSSTRKNYISSYRQDVLPLNTSPTAPQYPASANSQNGASHSGTQSSSSPSLNKHSTHRLRTPPPVFHNVSDLAAHHGIPQSLPPAPRTISSRSSTESSMQSDPEMPDIFSFCSDYLNMLSQNSVDTNTTHENQTATTQPPGFEDQEAVQAIMDVITKGGDFLTSPMESPYDDFLSTPGQKPGDFSDFTSPLIADDNGAFDSSPLFPSAGLFEFPHLKRRVSDSIPLSTNLDNLYTMSPVTPVLDSSSMRSTPVPSIIRYQNVPNGTRKNITPDSLTPLDAPVQPRKYITNSITSRKEEPPSNKRAHSVAFGDDDEEDVLKDDGLDTIAAKRLQNTLAARRSRKRKLEYQRELETAVERERAGQERWRARALTLEALLTSHGISVPPALNF